jgi:hypothetical protein
VGRTEESYRGGVAWLLRDEIETTAINARKFPNQDVLLEQHDGSKQPQPEEILDVVCIPPIEPFNKIWTSIDTKGHKKVQYNYLTDIIFHEAGHIEHRRLKNRQKGEGRVEAFPSEEQKKKFLSIIRQTKIFPTWITELIIANINRGTISEMYAMLIDREGTRRYDKDRYEEEDADFQKMLDGIEISVARKLLNDRHTTGRLLVRILEEQFPDFSVRKKFVRSVLERTPEKVRNV